MKYKKITVRVIKLLVTVIVITVMITMMTMKIMFSARAAPPELR